ncbi:MAG: hypothetical protein KAV00_17045 [Phycisphaerae bacterium]|nr:hypothetical protein [Phycisphaerae bacterium]
MASAFKPTYLRPIPEGAKRRKRKSDDKLVVEYTDKRDKKHVQLVHFDKHGNETGKMVCDQRTWWMRYSMPDGTPIRTKGYKDKIATEQEAARREKEAAQADTGLLLVDKEQLSAPITGHVEAFIADLERSGRAAKHYELLDTRLGRMIEACGWQTLRRITPDSLIGFLTDLKRRGFAPKTMNEYAHAAKNFCNWCVRTRRLAGNPLASVAKTEQGEKTYQRRALTDDEARRLLDVAGIRRLVYLTAIRTGLRRAELKQLQWGDVRDRPGRNKTRYRIASIYDQGQTRRYCPSPA